MCNYRNGGKGKNKLPLMKSRVYLKRHVFISVWCGELVLMKVACAVLSQHISKSFAAVI